MDIFHNNYSSSPTPLRFTERGNIFFMLFGAVALVGVLGAATVSLMRGPLTTMVEVNRRTMAESQMSIASKLGMMTSALQANDGDCEAVPDGFVEPYEWEDASNAGPDGVAGSEGGGWLANAYGVSKKDPWGTNFGYCVWDAGTTVADAGCGGAGQKRLAGSGTADRTYPVLALISAGPDRTFQTGCVSFATGDANSNATYDAGEKLVVKAAGSDDVVLEYTYAEASMTAGGLWELKAGQPNTAETPKSIEVGGGANFAGGSALIDPTTGQGTFPRIVTDYAQANTAPTIDFVDGLKLTNTGSAGANCSIGSGGPGLGTLGVDNANPTVLLGCLDNSGTPEWTILGGVGVDKWLDGTDPGDIHYPGGMVGIGTVNPSRMLDVAGDAGLTGDLFLADTKAVKWGDASTGIQGSGPGSLEILTGGSTRFTVDSSGLAGLGVSPAANTRLVIQGTGTTSASAALNVTDSAASSILYVQDDKKVGIGTVPNDALDVTGAADVSLGYKIDGNVVVYVPDGVAENILVGKDAGSLVSGDRNAVLGASAAAALAAGTDNVVVGQGAAGALSSGDYNTLIGQGVGPTLATGVRNILIGAHDSVAVDVPAAATDDYLNIGNTIYGDMASDYVGIGVPSPNDALDVAGNIDATGNVNTGGNFTINSVVFGPALECTAAQKLEWDNATGWSCVTDLNDGSAGSPDTLEEVLTSGNDANTLTAVNLGGVAIGSNTLSTGGTQDLELDVTGDIGADWYCDANGNNCFNAASVGSIDTFLELTDTPNAYTGAATWLVRVNAGATALEFVDSTTLSTAAAGNTGEVQFNNGGAFAASSNFFWDNAAIELGIGTSTPGASLDIATTDSVILPRGTSVQRPGTPVNGMIRYNNTANKFEVYENGVWKYIQTGAATALAFLDLSDTPAVYTGAAYKLAMVNPTETGIVFSYTDAVLLPAGTTAERPGTPSNGMIRYNSTNTKFEVYQGGAWVNLITSGAGSALAIDDLTDAQADYATDHNLIMGRPGATALAAGAQYNLFIGEGAGATTANSTATTTINTAIGYNALSSLTSGSANLAIGTESLTSNTAGQWNTAIGTQSLQNNTTGGFNTAIGMVSLRYNTTGSNNTAIAGGALYSNTTGDGNTGVGWNAMYSNTTGSYNIALGDGSLERNVAKSHNLALGYYALHYADDTATPGSGYNIAIGYQALMGSTTPAANTGTNNLALGYQALLEATSGGNNVAIGAGAGDAITTGANNIVIGYNVDTPTATTSNFLNIGDTVYGDLSTDQIRIGGSGALSGFSDLDVAGTLAVKLSAGATGQRPTTPANGMIRYNSTTNKFELYENGAWVNVITSGSGSGGTFISLTDTPSSYTGGAHKAVKVNAGETGLEFAGTDALVLPAGTTAQRPSSPSDGMIRFDSDKNRFEVYRNGAWVTMITSGAEGAPSVLLSSEMDAALGAINGTYAPSPSRDIHIMGYRTGGNPVNLIYDMSLGLFSGHWMEGYSNYFGNAYDIDDLEAPAGTFTGFEMRDNTYIKGYINGNVYMRVDGSTTLYTDSTAGNSTYYALSLVHKDSDSAGSNGIGVSITFNPENSVNNPGVWPEAAKISGIWDDVNNLSRDGSLRFYTAGPDTAATTTTEYMRLTSSGNLNLYGTGAIKVQSGATAQRPGSPVNGMIRYNSDSNKFEGYQNGAWQDILTSGGGAGSLDSLSDAETDYATDFNLLIGTPADAWAIAAGGQYNLTLGQTAGDSITTGDRNVAMGYGALTTGATMTDNVAIGYNALTLNQNSGTDNVAIGSRALDANTTGDQNVAIGTDALGGNTTSTGSVAIGYGAASTSGPNGPNVTIGRYAANSVVGFGNTVIGDYAGYEMTLGDENVYIGDEAGGSSNSVSNSGSSNVYIGNNSGFLNSTGSTNTAIGNMSGDSITTGSGNVIIGQGADVPAGNTSNFLNIGDTIFGDLSTDQIRIGGSGALSGFSDLDVAGTLAVKLSAGTTAQRPGTGVNGMIRYNSTSNKFEGYENGAWKDIIAAAGALSFLDLSDTPAVYTGAGYKLAMVNAGETGMIFSDTSAVLLPSGTTAQRPGTASNGMIRYNADNNRFEVYQGGAWVNLITSGAGSALAIDDLTDAATDYVTDHNMFIGQGAGAGVIAGANDNLFIGENAGAGALTAAATGNVFIGYKSGNINTSGGYNTAVGRGALEFNTIGSHNTVVGWHSSFRNSTGAYNTILGEDAFAYNTTGNRNTIVGRTAGYGVSTVTATSNNVFLGYSAGYGITTGGNNTLLGYQSGDSLTTGANNLLVGYDVDTPAATTSNFLNIGDTVYGDLSTDQIRIGGSGALSGFSDLDVAGTLAVQLSAGTTAQRPGTASNGMIRYNSTNNKFEGYENGVWTNIIGTVNAAGSDREVQFNNAGALGASSNFTYASTGDLSLKANSAISYSAEVASNTGWVYPSILGYKSGGTLAAKTALGSADTNLFAMDAYGYDGSAYVQAAGIGFQTDANPGLSDMPGRIVFFTTPDGAAVPLERARIDSSGNMGLGTNAPGARLHTNVTSTTGNTILEALRLSHEDSDSAAANSIGAALTFNLETATAGTNREAARIAGVWDDATDNSKDGSLRFYTMGPNAVSGTTTTSEYMRLDSTGRLLIGTTSATAGATVKIGTTDSIMLPSGTNAQRPGTPAGGMIRYNTDSTPKDVIEYYDAESAAWIQIPTGTAGGAVLSGITAATADNTINSAAWNQVWNWALTGTTEDGFVFGESAASTGGSGDQSILKAATLASSTAVPLMVTNLGNGLSLRVNDATDDSDTTPFIVDASGNVAIGAASVTAGAALDIATTDSLLLPRGTTAQRPGTPVNGMARYNSTTSVFEGYQAGAWVQLGSLWSDSAAGYIQYSTALGGIKIGSVTGAAAPLFPTGVSGGSSTFLALSDTPSAYTGAGYKVVKVNAGASALEFGGTDALLLPAGTTAQRPGTPTNGMIRYNSSNSQFEGYQGGSWGAIAGSSIWTDSGSGYIEYANSYGGIKVGSVTGAAAPTVGYALDDLSDVNATAPTNGHVLTWNSGTGNWVASAVTGTAANAAGSSTQIQFNDGGTAFGADSAFVWDKTNDRLGIGMTAPSVALDVTGDIEYSGTITDVSDRRLKTDIRPLNSHGSMLEKIGALETYSFRMKDDPKKQTEFGVIAQEIEKVFPELVRTDASPEHYKSVNYVGLIAPMIESAKELKARNESLRSEIDDLKEQVALLNKAAIGHTGKASMDGWAMILLGLMLGGNLAFFVRGGILRRKQG